MILPTKHLSQERALLTTGAKLLSQLTHPMTVSSLWENVVSQSNESGGRINVSVRYERFVLTLDLLYLIGAIELNEGLLSKVSV